MQYKKSVLIWLIPLFILSIPLIAMSFTDEVNWTFMDFLLAGILLFGALGTLEVVRKKIKNGILRYILWAVILTALILIWVELAVGLFDSPFGGN